jgi:hypothetical protein
LARSLYPIFQNNLYSFSCMLCYVLPLPPSFLPAVFQFTPSPLPELQCTNRELVLELVNALAIVESLPELAHSLTQGALLEKPPIVQQLCSKHLSILWNPKVYYGNAVHLFLTEESFLVSEKLIGLLPLSVTCAQYKVIVWSTCNLRGGGGQ